MVLIFTSKPFCESAGGPGELGEVETVHSEVSYFTAVHFMCRCVGV